ncbi:MAG: ribosome small subunit-dependent GTPase A [Bacteroidales bacterium]|nr:ribosome small subunit-dependent GTPase A [Bacteroidales bacterium]
MAKKSAKNRAGASSPAIEKSARRAEGMVIRNTGSSYMVLTDGADGSVVECRIKGNFRLKGIRTTNPVAVGDRVVIMQNPDGTAYITEITPRTNYIIRRASNLSKEASILAANVDQACLVATLAHPTTSTTFIDRFLATSEAYRVPAILVINKVDLLNEENTDGDGLADDTDGSGRELLDAVSYLYRSIGYEVIQVSAQTGEGLDILRDKLAGKITLLSGNSGVGKSTLINRLIPGLELKTGEISDVHDTGMHTTTFSEMFPLPGEAGGWIIDTPGVRGFGTIEMDQYEVSHFFPEIFRLSSECRYGNCTHTHEPACAVRQALAEGRIAMSRYSSYLSILSDTDPDKYRAPQGS